MTPIEHTQSLLNYMRRLGRPMTYSELDAYGAEKLNGPGIPTIDDATQLLLKQGLVKGSVDGFGLVPTSKPYPVEDEQVHGQAKLMRRIIHRIELVGGNGVLASNLFNYLKGKRAAFDAAADRLVANGQIIRHEQRNGAIRYSLPVANKDS